MHKSKYELAKLHLINNRYGQKIFVVAHVQNYSYPDNISPKKEEKKKKDSVHCFHFLLMC